MLKILSTRQIRELDAYTIAHEPIASIDLMERACRAFVTWLTPTVDTSKKIGIVCGTGNNGGDGLGIARMLHDWGYDVKVWIVRGGVPESEDFKVNLARLHTKTQPIDISNEPAPDIFSDRDVLIDAIFGSGLSRPAEGVYASVIKRINDSPTARVTVDIPSGLIADGPSAGEIVRAHHTLSFQLPKLAFFLPQSHPFTGEWTLADIGLHKGFIKNAGASYFCLTKKSIRKLLKARSRFDHKGTFGHALLVAGSYGKMGAAVLAARATLRTGAGLLTVHIPRQGYGIIQSAVPEAMADPDNHEHFFTGLGSPEKYTTMGIGPGLGQDAVTVKALATCLEKFAKPVVIDADALNILGANRELLHLVPHGSILTPHPKEFERLAGAWKTDFERLEKQKQLAASLKSVVIVKGAYTTIAAPDGNVYFNPTGNPGMATGGTGDVLTGILTGLLAQTYAPLHAALLGVYLHGLAGDLAMLENGMQGMIASDVVDFLPAAFRKILKE